VLLLLLLLLLRRLAAGDAGGQLRVCCGGVLKLLSGVLNLVALLLFKNRMLVQLMRHVRQTVHLGCADLVGGTRLDFRVVGMIKWRVAERLGVDGFKWLGTCRSRVEGIVMMRVGLRRRRIVRHGQHPIVDLPVAVVRHRVSSRERGADESGHVEIGSKPEGHSLSVAPRDGARVGAGSGMRRG